MVLRATCSRVTRLSSTFLLYSCLFSSPSSSFLHYGGNRGSLWSLPAHQHLHSSKASSSRSHGSGAGAREVRGQVMQVETGTRQLENLKVGDRLKGVVVSELEGKTGKKAWIRAGVTRTKKKGGVSYVDGMMRVDKEKGLKVRKVVVDKPVTVYVRKVFLAEGRFEVSLRPPKVPKIMVDAASLTTLTDLTVGDELQGIVKTVTQFAAFVSCGVGRPTKRLRPDGKPAVLEEVHGLLGKEDLPENAALSSQLVKSQDTTMIVNEGDRLTLYVKNVLPSNGRFRLTMDPAVTPEKISRMKNAAQRQNAKFSRRKELADLEVGEELSGQIVRAFEFGFFVDVGAKANGLVHISSISEKEDRYLGNLDDFASVGDEMYVKVNGLNDDGRLSLAYVGRGKDRPKAANRRQRRTAIAQERDGVAAATGNEGGGDGDEEDDDDEGGFLFENSARGNAEDDDEGGEGYESNLDYDSFDDF